MNGGAAAAGGAGASSDQQISQILAEVRPLFSPVGPTLVRNGGTGLPGPRLAPRVVQGQPCGELDQQSLAVRQCSS